MAGSHSIFETSEDNVDNPIPQSGTMILATYTYIQYVCQVPARIFSALTQNSEKNKFQVDCITLD
jgi:hypothetical protein